MNMKKLMLLSMAVLCAASGVCANVSIAFDAGGGTRATSQFSLGSQGLTFDKTTIPSWITSLTLHQSIGGMINTTIGLTPAVGTWNTSGSSSTCSLDVTVAENTGAARSWTMNICNQSNGSVAWSMVVSQSAGGGGTSYTVTFNPNGGTVSESTRSVASGSAVGTLPTPSYVGFSFGGWWTAADGGTQISASTVVTEAVTYYAHWTEVSEPVYYTVTFNPNGGTVSESSRNVASGSAVGTLPTPSYVGFSFGGWFTAVQGGRAILASEIITQDVTYYAHWFSAAAGDYSWSYSGDKYSGLTITDVFPTPSEMVEIPAVIDGIQVVTLGAELFLQNDLVTTIVVPQGVQQVGVDDKYGNGSVFEMSYSGGTLRDVYLPPSVVRFPGSFSFRFFRNAVLHMTVDGSPLSFGDYSFANFFGTLDVCALGAVPENMVKFGLYQWDNKEPGQIATTYYRCKQAYKEEWDAFFAGTDAEFLGYIDDDYEYSDPVLVADCADYRGYTWCYAGLSEGLNITGVSPQPSGLVEIPAVLDGMPVVKLATQFFTNNPPVATTVVVPGGVSEIDGRAFDGRHGNVREIYLPPSVVKLSGWNAISIAHGTTLHWTLSEAPLSIYRSSLANFWGIMDFTALGGVPEGMASILSADYIQPDAMTYRCKRAYKDEWDAFFAGTGAEFLGYIDDDYEYSEPVIVTFDANGGDGDSAYARMKGAELGPLPVPIRENYAFAGWFTAESGGERVSPSTMANENITYYAHWIVNHADYQGRTWYYSGEADGLSITNVSPQPRGLVEIPAMLNGIPVVKLATQFFTNNPPIATTVVVPQGVKEISRGFDVKWDGNVKEIYLPPSLVTMSGAWAVSMAKNCVAHWVVGDAPLSMDDFAHANFWGIMDVVALAGVPSGMSKPGLYHMPEIGTASSSLQAYTYRCKRAYKGEWDAFFAETGAEFLGYIDDDYEYSEPVIVTFDANGGDGAMSIARMLGMPIGELPEPKRDGHAFDGWFTAAEGGDMISSDTVATGDVTYYAHWTKNSYTITLNANSGTVDPASVALDYGTPILASLPTPVREGYTFDGWHTSWSNGTQLTDEVTVTENATYYAHWTINTYTVTLDANGGVIDGPDTFTGDYDSYISLPSSSREGWTFDGWFTDPVDGESAPLGYHFHSNATYYAHWTQIFCTVTFSSPGGDSETIYAYGDRLGTLPTPIFEDGDRAFLGWFLKDDDSVQATEDTVVTETVKYIAHFAAPANDTFATAQEISSTEGSITGYSDYASVESLLQDSSFPAAASLWYKWTAPEDGKVTFNTSGSECGTILVAQTLDEYGSTNIVACSWEYFPPNPCTITFTTEKDKLYYIMVGDIGEIYPPEYFMVTISGKVVLNWSFAPACTITFVGADDIVPVSIMPGETLGYNLPSPCRDHYNFIGWFTTPEGGEQLTEDFVVTGDMTLYAQWEAQTYTAWFEWNDYSAYYESRTVTIDSSLGTLPVPVREGWTFTGWFTAPEGGEQVAEDSIVTGDMTLYAQWTENKDPDPVTPDPVTPAPDPVTPNPVTPDPDPVTPDSEGIQSEMVGGINWSYVVTDGAVTVFGGRRQKWDSEENEYKWEYTPAIPSGTSGSIIVPSVLGGYKVTAIGDGAFTECERLTEVIVPSGVTILGQDAFSDCSALVHVTLPEGLTSIGGDAFDGCESLSSITIPDTVTRIGDNAFADCRKLASVYIPQSVVKIGRHAFARCSGLSSIQVPASLKPVVESGEVFYRCSANIEYYDGDGDCYAVLNASDITAPYTAEKAVTLQGVVYDGCDVVGIVELKLGKVNAKKHTGKVSGSLTTLDGKKHAIKAYNATEIDGTTSKAVSLDVKDLGTMNVTIGGEQFAGALGRYHVQSATVGGNWAGRGATVAVDADDLSMFAGRVLSDLLPKDEQATVNNGKWTFNKAAGVKWAKPKADASRSEYYDATSGKDLIVDDTKGKTNLSGLKLTYTPKKGTFKGSFKVYALEGEGKATKLKKYTVNVSGVVVGGVGYGEATCKKPAAGPWPVTVE